MEATFKHRLYIDKVRFLRMPSDNFYSASQLFLPARGGTHDCYIIKAVIFDKTKNFWKPQHLKQLTEVRNVGFYIFAVIVLAIAWSGVKTVQNNYELQKQIATLNQQNEVLKLSNENSALQGQFYETDQYLELAARQNLGLAAPGETVLLVPKTVAMKYVDPSLVSKPDSSSTNSAESSKSKFAQNFQDWRDFLLGRKLFD